MSKIIKRTKTNNQSTAMATRLSRVERYLRTHAGDIKAYAASSAFAPTTSGTVASLTPLAQGDTSETRTGLRVNGHTISLGVLFKMTATCTVRILLVRDTMQNGASPAVTDILDSADVIAPQNYINTVAQKRFIVIEDYTEHFSLNGNLSASRRKLHNYQHKVHYSGAGSTVAELRSNNVFAVVICDTNAAGQVNLYSQFRFTDE
jgi:hypothetical protein